ELAAILEHARDDLKPCIAIQAFAGLRTEELLRLTWEDVRRRPGYIEVEAGKAKTARRRLVPVSDALALWLAPHLQEKTGQKKTGPVWGFSKPFWFQCIENASKAAKTPWKQNVLRHSFISY